MEPVRVLILLVSFIGSVFADEEDLSEVSKGRRRTSRVSSEFGYSLQNADPSSTQFRQEQRDASGSVRGSYGFEDPTGRFRFVHYVADGGGFRAHISSNEPGVGRQSPASVSIEHIVEDTKGVQRSTLSGLSSEDRKQETKPDPARFDYYAPIQTGVLPGVANRQASVLNQHDAAYRYRSSADRQSSMRNPVEEYVRARLTGSDSLTGMTDHLSHRGYQQRSNQHQQLLDQRYQQRNPSSLHALFRVLAEENAVHSARQQSDAVQRSSYISNAPLSERRASDYSVPSERFDGSSENYGSFVLTSGTNQKQRVRISLPDCGSSSSAVLCNPSNSVAKAPRGQNSDSLADSLQSGYLKNLLSRRGSTAEDLRQSILYELSKESQYNSNPFHNRLYHDHSNFKLKTEHEVKHQDCSNNPKGLSHSSSQRQFGEDLYNTLTSYDRDDGYVPLGGSKSSEIDKNMEQLDYASALLKILESDRGLENLKQLLLKTPQASSDTPKQAAPKLGLLGILILPSSVLSELGYISERGTKDWRTQDSKDTSSETSILDQDVTGSGAEDQPIEESTDAATHNKTIPNGTHLFFDAKVPHYHAPDDDLTTPPLLLPVKHNQQVSSDHANSSTNGDTRPRSEFWVFDDVETSEGGDNVKGASPNFSADNWRKILEDEIRRDALQPDAPDHTSSDSEHQPHDDESPLYDSSGRPIKRENVPIHIHRLNLPPAMTSLPWKFSIPRPGPPRSVVMPPKPPVIS